jgi:hypothetical protein
MVKMTWGIGILLGLIVLLGFISFLDSGDLRGLCLSLITFYFLFYACFESLQKLLFNSWIGLVSMLFFQVLPVVYLYINRSIYFMETKDYIYFCTLLVCMVFTISLWVYYRIRKVSSDQIVTFQ